MFGAPLSFKSAYERSVEIRDRYREIIGNCESFLLRSVGGSRVFKCSNCGKIFAALEPPERCYSCFSRDISEVDDVIGEIRGYCWRLYGDYLAFSELLVELSKTICDRYNCDVYSTPSLSVRGPHVSFMIDIRKASGKSVILVNAYELSMETLRVLDEVTGLCIMRSRDLLRSNITHVVILTSYEWVRVGHEILLAEGFIDTVLHKGILVGLGLETLSLEGRIAKLIDLKTGGIASS